MGQYVDVILDNEDNFRTNVCLRLVVIYIGIHSGKSRRIRNDLDAYKEGVRVIDARLHGRHKNAIRALVYAKNTSILHRNGNKENHTLWKLHRKKAAKIFRKIRRIISKYDDTEIHSLFEDARKEIFGYDPAERSEIIGYPYYPNIDYPHFVQHYSESDKKALAECAKSIREYDSHLHIRAETKMHIGV